MAGIIAPPRGRLPGLHRRRAAVPSLHPPEISRVTVSTLVTPWDCWGLLGPGCWQGREGRAISLGTEFASG